jgi:sugar/nucleoside kinase (ribokinase family)
VPIYLACGHVTLDRGAGGDAPGGSVTYAGRAAAALGAAVRVLAGAGADFPRGALAGLEARLVPAPATTVFENRYGPDGARTQRVLAAAPPLSPGDLPARWREADVLHLAPVLGEVDVPAFRAAVRARVVGLGVQGLVRAVEPDGRVSQPRWRFAPADLEGVDFAFVGEDDLAGQDDLLVRLARAVPVVVATRGSRGCDVASGGRSRRVGVHPAAERDTTGAGDAFAAGYLVAAAAGADPWEAARLGAAVASLAIEGRGTEALERPGAGEEARARAARVPIDPV